MSINPEHGPGIPRPFLLRACRQSFGSLFMKWVFWGFPDTDKMQKLSGRNLAAHLPAWGITGHMRVQPKAGTPDKMGVNGL
jgi:hypothetical protein